jgi:hypothetical protein
MNFKEYDKFISEHKFDMLFMIIYYNLKCNELSESLTDGELETLITYIHRTYLKDEMHLDLAHICDKALDYKNEILKDILNVWDFLGVCYD